ncbi:hypothetical protein NDU88_002357 [Pleurodeles waltl]|uniref:Basic proline-rich protein-like n=1 Tax=Pleurodeles waltl TaxID=8319 RepID=A0AAV7TL03_PLEWA|nr:hypothetical protein NDU88_002357 [Pleurodeles waltl]
MIGSARSSGQDQSGQPKGALQPATRAPDPQLWKMTVGGTRRFPVVSPHKRPPVLNLGRPSVAGPIVGIQGLPGSRPQGSGHAFPREALPKWTPYRAAPGGPPPPCLTVLRSLSARGHQAPPPEQKADPTPADAPSRRSRPHLPLRVGPLSGPAPGAVPRSVRGRSRNSAANHVGPGPHQGAQVCQRPPPRPRPHPSRSACVGRSPTALQLGEPPGTARHGPACRPGRSLLTAPNSPNRLGARSGGARPHPRGPPVHSSRRTPLRTPDRPPQRIKAPLQSRPLRSRSVKRAPCSAPWPRPLARALCLHCYDSADIYQTA